MKVIYKKTIFDKLKEAIEKAKLSGKQIEKFILTPNEYEEFYFNGPLGFDITKFNGVYIEVEK